MKKLAALLALAIVLTASYNAFAAMWFLVHSEFNDGSFYCTYQIQGGNYQTTIVQQNACSQFIQR